MERKVKYDYAFKLECVELVLKKHYSCEWVSKQKGPNKSNINKWVKFYKQYGRTGLLPKKNQNYSTDFKLKVLKSIDDERPLQNNQECICYSNFDFFAFFFSKCHLFLFIL